MTYYTRCLSQYECWAHRNRQCWDYGPCTSIECAQRRQYNSLYLYPSARSFTDYYTPQIWIGPVSTTNNVLPPKVHRQRLKLKGSHGRDHVMMNYGFELLGPESIERMKTGFFNPRPEIDRVSELNTLNLNKEVIWHGKCMGCLRNTILTPLPFPAKTYRRIETTH